MPAWLTITLTVAALWAAAALAVCLIWALVARGLKRRGGR